MEKTHTDPEILYVQKLYFFMFLSTFYSVSCVLVFWLWGILSALCLLTVSFIISYIAMVKKNSFALPGKKITAQRMAQEITQISDPVSISRFASQLS